MPKKFNTPIEIVGDAVVNAAGDFLTYSGEAISKRIPSEVLSDIGAIAVVSGVSVVTHGENEATARPTGAAVVYWIGSVEPENAENGDIWYNAGEAPSATLDSLSDVEITDIASGEILKWNGSTWVNNTLAEAGISATGHGHTIGDVTGLEEALGAKLDAESAFDGDYNSLDNLPTLFDGDYESLENLPDLFDGEYTSLSNIPSTFTPSGHVHATTDVTSGTFTVPYGGTGLSTITSNSYLKGNGTGNLVQRTYSEVKTDLSLNNVENTALSTWVGASSITTLGTITTGTWNGTDIAVADGGTGRSTLTSGSYLVGAGTSQVSLLTSAEVLTDIGAAADSAVVKLSGDQTIAGVKTFSSTIVGSVNGNAATATALETARNINGTSFNGTANITVPGNFTNRTTNESGHLAFIGTTATGNQSLYTNTGLRVNPSTATITATTFSGALSGNASTATALATGRTIAISGAVTGTATSFNGTGNITIPITALDVGSATAGTLAVARGGTGIASYTTNNYIRASGSTSLEQRTPSQVLSDIGAAASSHNHDSRYMIIVEHGSTGSTARPAGATAVYWIGSVEPVNAEDGDIWYNSEEGTSQTLDGLANVTITSNSTGEILKWNGSVWVNNTLAEAGIASATEVSIVVVHGSTAGTARPAGAAHVIWKGSVEPENGEPGDVWYDTTGD